MTVFDRIRSATAAVSERACFVRIDQERLEALSRRLEECSREPLRLDPARQQQDSPRSTLAFVFTMNAINFGSGWFPQLRKRAGCSGYFTIATALEAHFDRNGPWTARELSALTAADCARLFGQDASGADVGDLMKLFAESLGELGRWLETRFAGRFEAILEMADHSAEALLLLLTEMPFYRDVSRYQELKVPFYKRAQLAAADLADAFRGEGYGAFRDLDELTMFADNLVPHVLRHEGVLVYREDLAEEIDAGQSLRAGSPEEVEIRAVALQAVERLSGAIRERGGHAPPHRLDFVLWNRGQSDESKARPRHRARTVYY